MSFATDFAVLHKQAGNPTLRCIKPKAQWTDDVPAGYSYDNDYDAYINGAGAIWTPTTADLPYDDVDILPSYGSSEFELVPGGITDTGSRTVRILPASHTTVTACQFALLDDIEYVVREATAFPAGAPLYYTVRLEKK
jgi:hypothetical protein